MDIDAITGVAVMFELGGIGYSSDEALTASRRSCAASNLTAQRTSRYRAINVGSYGRLKGKARGALSLLCV